MDNRELIDLLINEEQFQITQDGETNRLTQDITDSIEELVNEYEDLVEQETHNKEDILIAEKHIATLEKMLDKREINIKITTQFYSMGVSYNEM